MIEKLTFGDRECRFNLPDICPWCDRGISPIMLTSTSAVEGSEVGFIAACPVCKHLFFSLHVVSEDSWHQLSSRRISSPHLKFPPPNIPPEIKQHYPDFYQIYEQASVAEIGGLDKICGMAYRKALEILVKQYLIQQTPDNEEVLLNEPLGRSIARISFEKIRNLAKAISWIGNDQTHTVQKHPDYNIPEMKKFMLALCHLIVAEYVADDAADFVSS